MKELGELIALPRATGEIVDVLFAAPAVAPAAGQPGPSGAPPKAGARTRIVGGSEGDAAGCSFGLLGGCMPPPQAATPAGEAGGSSEPKGKRGGARARLAKPQGAAQAAPKLAAAAGNPPADGAAGKRTGPKPRDLAETATALINEWEGVTESSEPYFGSSWKTHSRYCKRLYDDIDAKLQPLQDLQQYNTLIRLNKHVSTIIAICKFVASHGLAHEALAEVLDQQTQFLTLDPLVEPRWHFDSR